MEYSSYPCCSSLSDEFRICPPFFLVFHSNASCHSPGGFALSKPQCGGELEALSGGRLKKYNGFLDLFKVI